MTQDAKTPERDAAVPRDPAILRDWYDGVYHGHRVSGGHPQGKPANHAEQEARNRECLVAMEMETRQTVLELGAGRGDTIYMLTREFSIPRVVAVDFSRVSADYCARCYPECLCLRADAGDLPFSPQSFDAVTLLDVTEHLLSAVYARMIGEIYRVLRPGGRVGVVPGLSRRPEHINLLPVGRVRDDFLEAGFELVAEQAYWFVVARPNSPGVGAEQSR